MAKQKKWNNQGGSKREYKSSGDYNSTTNIPAFDKLPESNLTSFIFSEQTKEDDADYGEFGDDLWTDWKSHTSDLELPEYKESDYTYKKRSSLEVDDNLEKSTLTKKIRTNKTTEYSSYIKSQDPDLMPESVYKEYEIIVKFKKLVLTILSGQSYACRNNLNNALFDFALVIRSSEPIEINEGAIGTLHTIESVGTKQDPMFAVYNWVLDKLKLATDNTGKKPDPILQRLPRRGVNSLPATKILWDGIQWNLFNSSGLEPTQICLHATNDVLKFRPTSPKNASFLWTVLSAGDPLSLCKSLLPTISISMAPGSATSLDPINGMSFIFRISIDSKQTTPTWVKFQINGDVPVAFYNIIGSFSNLNNEPIFIILANTDYIDISIEPLADNSQTVDRQLSVVLLEDTNTYEIEVDSQTVTVTAPVPNPPLFIAINDIGFNPRELIYDRNIDITQLASNFNPLIDILYGDLKIDVDSTNSNYWRVSGQYRDSNTGHTTFYSIDNLGVLNQHQILPSQWSTNGSNYRYFFIGKGRWICEETVNTIDPFFSNPAPLIRIWSPENNIQTGYTGSKIIALQQPSANDLNGFLSPTLATKTFKRSYLGDYYIDRQESLNYVNANVEVTYENLGLLTNCFLPLLIGEKSLYVKFETLSIPIKNISTTSGINKKNTTYNNKKNICGYDSHTYLKLDSNREYFDSTTITHYIDLLPIDLPSHESITGLEISEYTVTTTNITFNFGLGNRPKKLIDRTIVNFANLIVTSSSISYIDNPLWQKIFDSKFVVVTDRIKNCKFTNTSIPNLIQTGFGSSPETETWQLQSSDYVALNDYQNTTSFRGLVFINARFFDNTKTSIVASTSCYAKIYRSIEPESNIGRNSLYVFEFWVGYDGSIELKKIHERIIQAGEINHFDSSPSLAYYPGS